MWPFTSDEQEEDPAAEDFDLAAKELVVQAPDVDSGLGAMRDMYSEMGFKDNKRAEEILQSRSAEIRQKFGVRTPFNYEDAIYQSPVQIDTIEGKGDTPEAKRIDQLNKWEEESIAAISQRPEPIYVQNRDKYIRDVQKAAVVQARQVYGEDNYLVTDWALRFGEGSLGGIANLLGLDSVEDYFQSRTKEEWDSSLGSAVASGAGFGLTALGIGALTSGTAAIGYMGASGLGQVRKQYEEAKETGATEGEALGAGAIELASQAVQLGTGEKIIGGALEKLAGKATTEALGAQVFPRLAQKVALGAGGGVVGSAASTEARNVGQGLDDPIINKGTLITAAAGGIVSGVITGGSEIGAARRAKAIEELRSGAPTKSPLQGQLDEEAQVTALKHAVEAVEGETPPPHEGVKIPPRVVQLENPKLVATREDGSTLVTQDGRLHSEANGEVKEPYQHTFFVDKAVADKLRDKFSRDGVGVHLTVEDGKLYADSEFLTPDLTVANDKTGVSKRQVIGSKEGTVGMVDVQVNEAMHEDGHRVFPYDIGSSPIESIAGAASIKMAPTGFMGRMQDMYGRQERKYNQRLRSILPPDVAERYGLAVTSYEEHADGTITEVQHPLGLYDTYSREQGIADANAFIDKYGIYNVLEYFSNLTKFSKDDTYIAGILRQRLEAAKLQAFAEGRHSDASAFESLAGEATFYEATVLGEHGAGLEAGKYLSAGLTADGRITSIKLSKLKEAEGEVAKELGVSEVNHQRLATEVEKHGEVAKELEKAVPDPVDRKVAQLEANRDLLDKDSPQRAEIQKNIDELESKLQTTPRNSNRKKLAKALTDAGQAQQKLNKVQQKFEEKLATFPEEDQQRLRDLYTVLSKVQDPTYQLKVNKSIFDIEAKHMAFTPEATDKLFSYWRKNVLSGTDTAMRNFWGNMTALISTPLAHAARGHFTEAGLYVKGALGVGAEKVPGQKGDSGLRRGFLEAAEIMAGHRRGRLTLEAGESPEAPHELRTMSGKPLALLNPLNYLLDITEIMHRGLGAADAIFANSAKEGQAYMAAYMMEAKGAPRELRQKLLDEALYRTDYYKAALRRELDTHVEALESAGIEVSAREKELMFYEGMERNRSSILNQIAERHAFTNTFMNKPNDSFFGNMAKGLNKIATSKLRIGDRTIQPLKEELAFLNTAANVIDYWLAHTPAGLGHYFDLKGQHKESLAKAIEMRTKGNELFLRAEKLVDRGEEAAAAKLEAKATKLIDDAKGVPYMHVLEMREQMGRMMIGTSVMLTFGAILDHYADDPEPFIRFNGLAPKGDRQKWLSEGRREFSLQVGDTVIPMEMLGPLAIGFAFADNVVKAKRSGQDLEHVAVNTAISSMGVLSSISFLKNAGDFFQMLHGGDPVDEKSKGWAKLMNNVKTGLASYAQPFIPASGFLRNIYKWYDGSPQETYNNFTAKFTNNIPFAQTMLGTKEKLNRFGERIDPSLWERSPGNIFISSIHDDPVTKWMRRSGYDFSDIGPVLSLNKGEQKAFGAKREAQDLYKDTLNEEESYQVLKISGPEIKRYLETLVNNPSYSTLTEANQEKINTKVNQIRARARHQVLTQR